MSVEDLRTWSLAHSLSIDVYVVASRYLMNDFKECISAYIINNFEIAGMEAALPTVLQSCKKLSLGVSPMDSLLKKVFARVGFCRCSPSSVLCYLVLAGPRHFSFIGTIGPCSLSNMSIRPLIKYSK